MAKKDRYSHPKYTKKELYLKAIDIIKEKQCIFIADMISYMPCDKSTFLRYIPVDTDEYNELKALINHNKVETKLQIRGKLLNGRGMELIALYKLLASPDELRSLSTQVNENTNTNKNLNIELDSNKAKELWKQLNDEY